jgi:hypothetical protein
MEKKERTMTNEALPKFRAKIFVVAVLAVSLVLLPSGVFGQERRGATVRVSLKDGLQREGELIAVKPNSVLILDSMGRDVSIDLADIGRLRVVRRSKAGQGAFLGLLGGVAAGVGGGSIYAKAKGMCPDCEAPFARFGLGLLGGVFGLAGGLIAGSAAGKDLDIQIDGLDESAMKPALQKLRKYARIQAYR